MGTAKNTNAICTGVMSMEIECPNCHRFTVLKKCGGVYSGVCTNCYPGVRFSVVAISRISQRKNKIKEAR